MPVNWCPLGSALGPRCVALYVWEGVQGARPALFNCGSLEIEKAAQWPPSVAVLGCSGLFQCDPEFGLVLHKLADAVRYLVLVRDIFALGFQIVYFRF